MQKLKAKKCRRLTLAVFCVFPFAFGNAGHPTPLGAQPASDSPPILIGLLLPPEETEAASLRHGVELGVDHANRVEPGPPRLGRPDVYAANELPGAKVALLVRGRVGQWGTDGEEAGRMVLNDGAHGLIAPPGGAPSHLALQIAGRTATPVVSLCPDSSVVGAGIPWMVRIVPSTRDEAQFLFSSFQIDSAGRALRWSALVPKERAGREVTRDLRQAAIATSLALDNPIEVSPQLSDFSEITKRMLASQPDGILLWLEASLAGRLAKSLRAAGFAGQLAGPGRLQTAAFTTNAGLAAEGFVLPGAVVDAPSQSVAARFTAEYVRQFGVEPDPTACAAYDAVGLLADRLRKSGDQPARHLFPITNEQPGATGNLKFDRAGNRIVALEGLQFRNGRFTAMPSPAKRVSSPTVIAVPDRRVALEP